MWSWNMKNEKNEQEEKEVEKEEKECVKLHFKQLRG